MMRGLDVGIQLEGSLEPDRGQAAAGLVGQARALAEAGRYRDAIDLLASRPPESLDHRTLGDLVVWRNAAFDPEPGQAQWPVRYADPFPGAQTPPEIQVQDLSVEILGGAIQHHGSLIVRGMINAEQADHLEQVVRKAFAACASVGVGNQAEDSNGWYAPYPLKPGDGLDGIARAFDPGGVWTGDSPRALSDFIAFLKAHGVIRVIEDYLGERSFLSLGKSTLRIVAPDSGAGWHQDGAFLGRDIRTVNVWLALTDCGVDAPGLDVYPRRLNDFAEMGTRDALAWWVVANGVIEDMGKVVPIQAPVFKAGDAMLFDQLYLHRTGVRPGMTRERLAIESWFFAGSTFPMQQMPLAL